MIMPAKIHITQDQYGFWFMSMEEPDGTLRLLAHHFTKPDHLIEQAHEMASEVKIQSGRTAANAFLERAAGSDIVVVTDPSRGNVSPNPEDWPADYLPPQPRKAGE
jgi:hypothetical protein